MQKSEKLQSIPSVEDDQLLNVLDLLTESFQRYWEESTPGDWVDNWSGGISSTHPDYVEEAVAIEMYDRDQRFVNFAKNEGKYILAALRMLQDKVEEGRDESA